jgi:hypothetical protein
MSLLEIMVAGALMLGLTGLVLSVLYPSFRASSRNASRVEMQQQAALVMERLLLDLESAATASVSVHPEGLAIQQLDGVTGTGLQIWKKELIVYSRMGTTLVRERWPPAPPVLLVVLVDAYPTRITSVDLAAIIAARNGSERKLAFGVTAFDLDPNLSFRIALERKIPGRPESETFELQRRVTLRNQW